MSACIRLCVLWLLCALPAASWAVIDVSALGDVPVQHEGRVKPLSSFARLSWQHFSGSDKDALEHLAQALFDPAAALERPQIKLGNAQVRQMLKLPEREDALYSYHELLPALRLQQTTYAALVQQDPNQDTATQKALRTVFAQIDNMTQLTASLSLFIPLDVVPSPALRQQFGWPEVRLINSYYGLAAGYGLLQQRMQQIAQNKGDDLAAFSDEETAIALLSMRLSAIESTSRANALLRVIASDVAEEWVAPWQVLLQGAGTPQMAPVMQHWQALLLAYQQQDQTAWDRHVAAIIDAQSAFYNADIVAAEQFYYDLNVLNISIFSYVAVLFMALLGGQRLGMGLMSFALAQHALMLALRVFILGRPPVSSLYESVLFVAFVAALCGCVIAAKSRAREGLLIGAGLGAFLLAISGIYAGEQDPMAMPIAVLNTNFWLATHVLVITAGYGATLVAGSMAHVALLSAASKTHRYLQGTSIVALLLTTIGTILGGVWADQSWGRFWGWDPKENGALLIVLWLAWLLHARLTHYVGKRGFAALLACSNIMVALSWFGVNLLNVGLHSYGFTSEAVIGLALFCGVEALLIAGLYLRYQRKRENVS